MLKKISLLLLPLVFAHTLCTASQPKLIVLISLDQFRYDYLVRFRQHFTENGFAFLLKNGANFSSATYKQSSTMTGPAHAVLLGGTYANQNGIIGNDWYDVAQQKRVYCVEDNTVIPVGAPGKGMSPANFIGYTFGDALRLHTGFESKVISISNKDRSAVLMAGKLANAAYWMVDSAFVSSTYYIDKLPDWAQEFNRSGKINSYFNQRWEKALPSAAYDVLGPDDVSYEANEDGLGRSFPHRITGSDTTRITPSYYSAVLTSPFGSEIVSAFVKEALLAERLGKRAVTDLLCIGFSSNDYVGHLYGPDSHEVMDMVVRTDRILADLFSFIDREIALSNCLIILTADHGVATIPEFILANYPSADAARLKHRDFVSYCTAALNGSFGALKTTSSWFADIVGQNIYLNRKAVAEKKLTVSRVAGVLAESLRKHPRVTTAFSREEILALFPSSPVEKALRNSFHYDRSGNVLYVYKPYHFERGAATGTTHGSPYNYDSHVPLIMVGRGIKPGVYRHDTSPVDIGHTLSALLEIQFPSGRQGRVLQEALER